VLHSRYLLVLPITNATSETVTNAVARAFTELPTTMRNADWDRRVEMARPTEFTSATSIPVFFCDAQWPLAARQQREQPFTAPIPSRRRPTCPCTSTK
jgi:IS30 family transposase